MSITIPDYRSTLTLTDGEIEKMMQIIYPSMVEGGEGAAKIDSIDRTSGDIIGINVECTYYDCEDNTPFVCTEYFELDGYGDLEAYDIPIGRELPQIRKYLFSLGCCELLRDNPFL